MSNSRITGACNCYGDSLAAYDKLPPTARAALQNSAFDWSASPVLSRHRRAVNGYRTGKEIAASVAKWDRDQHAKDAKKGIVAP